MDFKEQLRYRFSRLPRLEQIAPGSNMFLTFSNGHYSDLMLNVASLVAELGYPLVVLTFDHEAAGVCKEYGLPFIMSEVQMDAQDFRQDRSKFLLMGAQKPNAVVKLFDTLKVATVALIDTDTIWLRDPFPWLEEHPEADMFVTTDCLSHAAELYHPPWHPRCGHVPGGTGGGWALNTGITIWRDRPGTRAFARDWHDYMGHNELHQQGVDDQYSFNVLMTSRDLERHSKAYPLRRVEGDERVFYAAPNDTVKLMVLPSAVFAGGKTMFYSHLPQKYGLAPYVVHATFQRYNNNGKRHRFREAMAYTLDPPSYYNTGNFLVYENLALEFVQAVESLASGPLTLVHKQLLAASYQLAALRDAAAMAKALGRILVLPRMYAYCDTDNAPTILQACHFEGAELELPFKAPDDLYANLDVLEDGSNFLPYRESSFLANPKTPLQLRWSTTSLWLSFPGAELPRHFATGAYAHPSDQASLEAAVAPLRDVRVLRVQNLQPGSFQGFRSDRDNAAFNAWFDRMMYDMKWCCTTQIGDFKARRYDAVYYARPEPLPRSAAQHWRVPIFERPSYCSNQTVIEAMGREWSKPLDFRMHPCNFLAQSPTLPAWGPSLWKELTRLREANRIRDLLTS